jgi:hypothetical protein
MFLFFKCHFIYFIIFVYSKNLFTISYSSSSCFNQKDYPKNEKGACPFEHAPITHEASLGLAR